MFFNQKNASDEYKTYQKNKKWKRVRQIGFDNIKKKPIYDELTYEYFVNHLGEEWMFNYAAGEKTISISVASYYELGILDWRDDSWNLQYYETEEQLLADNIIMGKSIKDIWEELEN